MKLLFVCSSNICRSPYAEFHMKKAAEDNPALKEKLEWVASAAVLNRARHMNKKTRAALLSEGFPEAELDRFRPKLLRDRKDLLRQADAVVGMTGWQKALLPKAQKKKYLTLSEAATGTYKPIPDPWLFGGKRYAECLEAMLVYLKLLADRIARGDEILGD